MHGKWKEAYGKIEVFNNKSVIVPLSRETRKMGDCKNPFVGIVDEYHNHLTSEIYDVLQSGMVASKEPLMFVITTAGFVVIAAVQLDLATESGNFMRNAMILFLIGMEGISMIENLGKLGIRVPKFLANAFSQMQMDNDDKTKDGEGK